MTHLYVTVRRTYLDLQPYFADGERSEVEDKDGCVRMRNASCRVGDFA